MLKTLEITIQIQCYIGKSLLNKNKKYKVSCYATIRHVYLK
jgi:hypothetical protein